MAIDRRTLFRGLSSAALSLVALSQTGAASALISEGAGSTRGELFFTSARRGRGSYCLLVLNAEGRILREIPLATRGHDAVIHEVSGRGVVFARRPGTFAVSFGVEDQIPPIVFTTPAGRHFYGHGAFSPDGHLLYATENDFDAARGVIGVYDVEAGFERIGEFDSHGIGPHDLLLSPDGITLVVAHGGIETHPDAGRAKLNVATMSPSLVFIDRRSGDLLAHHQFTSDLHKLSIRHLDIDRAGRVWFGGQWEGSLDEAPSLIGSASRDGDLRLVPDLAPVAKGLRGYIGSVATDRSGRLLAASAPRAGRSLVIETASGRIVREVRLVDGCGIAPASNSGFLLSSGEGRLIELQAGRPSQQAHHDDVAFDNHMVGLPPRAGT